MGSFLFIVPSPNSFHNGSVRRFTVKSRTPKQKNDSSPTPVSSSAQDQTKLLDRVPTLKQIQQATPPTTPVTRLASKARPLRRVLKKPNLKAVHITDSLCDEEPECPTQLPSPPVTPQSSLPPNATQKVESVSKIPQPVDNYRVRRIGRLPLSPGTSKRNEKVNEASIPAIPIESSVAHPIQPVTQLNVLNDTNTTTEAKEISTELTILARRAAFIAQIKDTQPLTLTPQWINIDVPKRLLRNRLSIMPSIKKDLHKALQQRNQKNDSKAEASLPIVTSPIIPAKAKNALFNDVLKELRGKVKTTVGSEPINSKLQRAITSKPETRADLLSKLRSKVKPIEGSESLKSHLRKTETIAKRNDQEDDEREHKALVQRKFRSEADKHPAFIAELKGVLRDRSNAPPKVTVDRKEPMSKLSNESRHAITQSESETRPEVQVVVLKPPQSDGSVFAAETRPQNTTSAANKENIISSFSGSRNASSSSESQHTNVASLINRFASNRRSNNQGIEAALHPLAGAHIRRLNMPQLLDTDRASSNTDTQREIEALRSMGRVGTGGISLMKTRAFGGDGSSNVCEDDEKNALSLKCRAILQKYGKC